MTPTPPALTGVHHVKLPVSDLTRSREWYERVLGLRVLVDFPDDDGVVRGLAGLLGDGQSPVPVALRQNATAAAGLAGFDPVSFAVADKAATVSWARHWDELGVEHSDVREGTLGWVVDVCDPDGIVLRLYSGDPDGEGGGEVDHTGEAGFARTVSERRSVS